MGRRKAMEKMLEESELVVYHGEGYGPQNDHEYSFHVITYSDERGYQYMSLTAEGAEICLQAQEMTQNDDGVWARNELGLWSSSVLAYSPQEAIDSLSDPRLII